MALVMTDGAGRDVRELEGVTFDLAYGYDENSWSLTVDTSSDVRLEQGARIYLEGTEYGGVYDGREVDTEESEITYTGRTWSGILAMRVLVPDRGSDYLTYSCDANRLIEQVIERLSLGALFRAEETDSGMAASGRFDRYADAYSGLRKALAAAGAKLRMAYDGSRVTLSAVPIEYYTEGRALDADEVTLKIEQDRGCVNHLVCAGSGELRDRLEVHLYADREHNISRTQTLFGVDEVAEFYDYSNASHSDLLERGIARLRDLQKGSERIKLEIDSDRELDIDDVVEGTDPETGYRVNAAVSKKIVSVSGPETQVQYEATAAAVVNVTG